MIQYVRGRSAKRGKAANITTFDALVIGGGSLDFEATPILPSTMMPAYWQKLFWTFTNRHGAGSNTPLFGMENQGL
jgi:hypothetical protein